jgi:toxin ParE1/3/4
LASGRGRAAARWHVRLSAAADADFAAILTWTAQRFGTEQARRYRATLMDAIRALRMGPRTLGARERDDISEGLHTLHVARGKRSERHVILFRLSEDRGNATVEIARLLHDSMDFSRHAPD